MWTYRRGAQSRAAEVAAKPGSTDRLTRAILGTPRLIHVFAHIARHPGARLLDTRHCERARIGCIAVMRHYL